MITNYLIAVVKLLLSDRNSLYELTLKNEPMINWNKGIKEGPLPGKRVAIQLNDGRVASGMVTETGGFALEYVDSMDILFSYMKGECNWIYIDE